MNLGRVNGPALKAADLILVLNSPVPWVPKHMQPNKDARLIHIAPDPHFTTYPFRRLRDGPRHRRRSGCVAHDSG